MYQKFKNFKNQDEVKILNNYFKDARIHGTGDLLDSNNSPVQGFVVSKIREIPEYI